MDSNARLVSFTAPNLSELNAGLTIQYNSGSATAPFVVDLGGVTTVLGTVTIRDNKTALRSALAGLGWSGSSNLTGNKADACTP